MTLLAILQRELRLEARRPHNYWLRVLGAALMAFVFMGLVTRDDKSAALLGARLFPHFHIILFATVSLIAPLLTADCLATDHHPVFRIPHHNVVAIVSGLSLERIRVV